jgi:acetyl esterase
MPLHPAFADKLHLLDGMTSIGAALEDPEQSSRIAEFMHIGQGGPPPVASTRVAEAPGPHGGVRVRVYCPDGEQLEDRPALVWVHGGGFTMGNPDEPASDRLAREMCARVGAVVISVDYRLAGEDVSYPVPHDDVVAAVRWVRNSADELGIDPLRISLGGDSAGGNLAAGAALRLRDDDCWAPSALLLAYPILHPVLPPLSPGLARAVAELPDLLRFLPEEVAAMVRTYVGGPESRADGYAMPGLAVLEGLCPTVVVNAECDDLRASGEAFAAAAALAGVDVRQVTAMGMLHAFLHLPDTFPAVSRVHALFAEAVRGTRGTGDVAPPENLARRSDAPQGIA